MDKKPLQSEGFSKCSALILKNEDTLQSALFHIDDIGLKYQQRTVLEEFMINYIDKLAIDQQVKSFLLSTASDIANYLSPKAMKRKDFQIRMEELNSNGVLKAQYIVGSESRNLKDRIVGELLGYLGLIVEDDILVNTGGSHWSLVYKPNEAQVFVDARSQNKVFIYNF